MATHTLFDGRLQIYRRTDHGPWQAAARVGGQRFRQTTGETALEAPASEGARSGFRPEGGSPNPAQGNALGTR